MSGSKFADEKRTQIRQRNIKQGNFRQINPSQGNKITSNLAYTQNVEVRTINHWRQKLSKETTARHKTEDLSADGVLPKVKTSTARPNDHYYLYGHADTQK